MCNQWIFHIAIRPILTASFFSSSFKFRVLQHFICIHIFRFVLFAFLRDDKTRLCPKNGDWNSKTRCGRSGRRREQRWKLFWCYNRYVWVFFFHLSFVSRLRKAAKPRSHTAELAVWMDWGNNVTLSKAIFGYCFPFIKSSNNNKNSTVIMEYV